ncbi:MAG: hypothetical protein M3Z20_21165 [Chloroflexota bacterium]|nr:hypothetical protein [Chloroflexota bacterium]
MAPSINIEPRYVMILVDEGQTSGEATVTYRSPDVVPVIWERKLGSRWERRVVDLYSGQYVIELEAGDVYEVLLYDRSDVDPNVAIDDPGSPVDRAAAAGLTKRTETVFTENEEKSAGGTYVAWVPNNSVGTKFRAIMDVGRSAPLQTDEGVDFIPNPMAVLTSDYATSHILWFGSEAIIPETEYWAALLLVGEEGGWQSVTYLFKTQKRDVELILKFAHIINDGSAGTNEASFRFFVLDGNAFADACYLDERTIWDKGNEEGQFSLEYLALSADCNVPMHITSREGMTDRGFVAVLTRGIGKVVDNNDDISGNFNPSNDFPDNPPFQHDIFPDAFLYLPVATNRDQPEELEDVDFETVVVPLNNPGDNEFRYSVVATYSVTYS